VGAGVDEDDDEVDVLPEVEVEVAVVEVDVTDPSRPNHLIASAARGGTLWPTFCARIAWNLGP
jgi:hypothetical protein